MGTVMLKCFVGGVAGILVWLIAESQAPKNFYDPTWDSFERWYVFWLGLVIGASIGGVSGWLQGGKIHLLRGVLLGGLFGAIGMMFGHMAGAALFHILSPTGAFVTNVIGRTVAFTLMGGFLGLAIGGSTFNGKRAMQGLIGGALAGAAGGLLFDVVSQALAPSIQQVRSDTGKGTSEVGITGRALMALFLGAVIGLFIGLVERISRSAWIRLILGRNEGKEWSIDGAVTTLGRSESATIPLFGDPQVGPIHAEIQRHGPQVYVLLDRGTPLGTYVNGQRVQQAALVPGSLIQIGSFQLEFLMKNSPAPNRSAEMLRAQMAYPHGGAQYPRPTAAGPVMSPGPAAPAAAAPAPGSLYSGAGGGAPASTFAMPSQSMPAANPAAYNQTVAYGAPAGALGVVALDGPLAGQRFPIAGGLSLGRESPQVPMAYDQQASRRHAELTAGPGFVNVQDAGSTNGTYVNNQRVTSAQARPGDVIKIGSTSFRVEAS